jgi:hypothetical protein
MGDPTGGAALDRYTALVAALLGVRTDYASRRFDAEVTAALAANRIDVATARTLRWWQRESVREVEGYAGSVLPTVLAARSDAEIAAAIETDNSAASWLQALTIGPSPAPEAIGEPELVAAAEPVAEPQPPVLPPRVITIPDPSARRDPSTRRRSAKEIQQAVREALRATAVPSPQDASSHGRDRDDAHSAPTA